MFRAARFLSFVLCLSTLPCAQLSLAQQSDPVPLQLAQMSSTNIYTRVAAFYGLLRLAPQPSGTTGVPSISDSTSALLALYPTDRTAIVSALGSLLGTELTDGSLATLMSTPTDETPVDFCLDLIQAVVALNDVSTIPSLVAALPNGAMVTDRLASFGPVAVDPVAAAVYNDDVTVRHAAAFTLMTMLQPQFANLYSEPTSQSKIRAGLTLAIRSFAGPFASLGAFFQTFVNTLPAQVPGDLNGDGVVNCADLQLVIAAQGTKVGQLGFDIRADLDGDGHVTGLDFSTESKLVAAAMGIPPGQVVSTCK